MQAKTCTAMNAKIKKKNIFSIASLNYKYSLPKLNVDPESIIILRILISLISLIKLYKRVSLVNLTMPFKSLL